MFTFKPICQDENNAFWECYKRKRVSSAEGRERERERDGRRGSSKRTMAKK